MSAWSFDLDIFSYFDLKWLYYGVLYIHILRSFKFGFFDRFQNIVGWFKSLSEVIILFIDFVFECFIVNSVIGYKIFVSLSDITYMVGVYSFTFGYGDNFYFHHDSMYYIASLFSYNE